MRLVIAIGMLMVLIWAMRTPPEEIGGFAGKVIHGFEQARQ